MRPQQLATTGMSAVPVLEVSHPPLLVPLRLPMPSTGPTMLELRPIGPLRKPTRNGRRHLLPAQRIRIPPLLQAGIKRSEFKARGQSLEAASHCQLD